MTIPRINWEPEIILAQVGEVQLREEGTEAWVPCIRPGNDHFNATVLYDLLRFGVSWKTLRDRYPSLTEGESAQGVVNYIRSCGRMIATDWIEGQGFTRFEIVEEGIA